MFHFSLYFRVQFGDIPLNFLYLWHRQRKRAVAQGLGEQIAHTGTLVQGPTNQLLLPVTGL